MSKHALSGVGRLPLALVCLLASGLISSGCRRHVKPVPVEGKDVVARVGSVAITGAEFRAEAERQHALSQAVADPQAFLQRLIDREALVSLALQDGLYRDPEVRRQYENLLLGALRQRRLDPGLEQLSVSDQEIKDYYDQHQPRYRIAGSIRVAVLRLGGRTAATASATAQLEGVRAAVLQNGGDGPGFGSLAIENSDHQASRYKGGDIGWLRDGKGPDWLPAPVLAAAWQATEVGQVSEVISADGAVFLTRLLERKEAGSRPLEEVSGQIRADILQQKRRDLEAALTATARRSLTIAVHDRTLAEAVGALRARLRSDKAESEPPPLP